MNYQKYIEILNNITTPGSLTIGCMGRICHPDKGVKIVRQFAEAITNDMYKLGIENKHSLPFKYGEIISGTPLIRKHLKDGEFDYAGIKELNSYVIVLYCYHYQELKDEFWKIANHEFSILNEEVFVGQWHQRKFKYTNVKTMESYFQLDYEREAFERYVKLLQLNS